MARFKSVSTCWLLDEEGIYINLPGNGISPIDEGSSCPCCVYGIGTCSLRVQEPLKH